MPLSFRFRSRDDHPMVGPLWCLKKIEMFLDFPSSTSEWKDEGEAAVLLFAHNGRYGVPYATTLLIGGGGFACHTCGHFQLLLGFHIT